MSATTQAPIVPPRPTKTQETPKIPPRPARRAVDRSLSPSRDRFAPSPLDSLLSKSPNHRAHVSNGPSHLSSDPIDRAGSVDLPSVGEEGMEYAAVAEELSASKSQAGSSRAASPEHTRTVGDDIKLHAPKPSLPAISAKQRVATVTRTDSDKAAFYGIGQPSGDSIRKKGSTTSQELSSNEDNLEDDEHGIPEIGRQVPMYPNAGDVQAPSPAPDATDAATDGAKKHQDRNKSARGFCDLPPGSYGLHGHGVIASDKFEKAYYGKHPELVEKEHTPHHSDRAQDYSLTSADLNKIVRETASRGTGIATHDIIGTPSEQVGWQAIEESASRPASVAPKGKSNSFGQSSTSAGTAKSATPGISFSSPPEEQSDSNVIHVDDPNNRRKSVMFSEEESSELEYESEAPILAPDEVAKDPSYYDHEPAVEPTLERRLSSFDGEEGSSRPSSRPASIHRNSHITEESAIAEEKAEDDYEPLFKDDGTKASKALSISSKSLTGDDTPNRFPSRDIWEDAPSSVHYTAEVSTPDMLSRPGQQAEGYMNHPPVSDPPTRDGETPAQAFARQQEELAEKELHGPDAFAENRKPHKPLATPWGTQQSHLAKEVLAPAGSTHASTSPAASSADSLRRPAMGLRFPSRDVWEDAPDSLQLQTVVSNPQEEPSPVEPTKPQIPQRPLRKLTDPSEKATPAVPSRPKPRSAASEEDANSSIKSAVVDKPKPQVPARPVRQHLPNAEQNSESAPRAKPAVPGRPFGGKIGQLQANFMSDLNKKLKIGPQVHKKEESAETAEEAPEEVEKAPLVDARKGRARGPQRRAPRSSPSPAAGAAAAAGAGAVSTSAPLSLGFSTTTTLYSIDPEEGALVVSGDKEVSPIPEVEDTQPEKAAEEEKEEEVAKTEKTETLAANTAGETVAEAKVAATPAGDAVEPTASDDTVAEE